MSDETLDGLAPTTHPDNEPGKSYQIDDRRRTAALEACNGLPTEWLERGLIQELYKFVAVISLADHMADKNRPSIEIPRGWWTEHVRGGINKLNEIAEPTWLSKSH